MMREASTIKLATEGTIDSKAWRDSLSPSLREMILSERKSLTARSILKIVRSDRFSSDIRLQKTIIKSNIYATLSK